jgi:hypothetical protein
VGSERGAGDDAHAKVPIKSHTDSRDVIILR